MKRELLLACFLFSSLALSKGGPKSADSSSVQSSATKIVDKLQKAWDDAKSYQATFHQVVFAKRLGTRDESDGMLYVVKPNKLRWESKSDGGIQILNGKKLIVIQENRRRGNRVVDIYPNAAKAVDSKPLGFLAGRAKFRDLYNIKLVSETPEIAELKLTPKETSPETFVAEIDKRSYLLRSLVTESVDSRVKIEFTDIKTNLALEDKWFEFKPKSTDIIHNQ